jgi:hypothetical protein
MGTEPMDGHRAASQETCRRFERALGGVPRRPVEVVAAADLIIAASAPEGSPGADG